MKKPELLAPAGDLLRCRTAIRYGADAVYLGGQKYSLRSRASNFSLAEIGQACEYARMHNARIHVTVNIIPHTDDFEGLEEYLKQLRDLGVTAIIAASPAVMALAHETAPELEVHCSTQMSVTNSKAARLFKEKLQISRVVLARECTMDQVRDLTENCPVETEAFIHGGMCVNYSGRCTLSNRMTLRDANRGGCAQSCRWHYFLYDGNQNITDPDQKFTMGSKDLCAAQILPALISAGVSSLKIEGRMKTEYYVASIVSGYRQLIDEICENDGSMAEERMQYHLNRILKGENRLTCTGFYEGNTGESSLIYRPNSNADVNHDFLAKVLKWGNGTAWIETRNPFTRHQEMELLSPEGNDPVFSPDWIRDENGNYLEESVRPMAVLQIPMPFAAEKEDILRRHSK